jgi:TM2 domain-containing membrane protein YozV
VSNKQWLVTLLLCFFFGWLGAHRFYVGKTATAILQLVTLGGLGIWALVDLVVILMGRFTDKEGRPVEAWT